jgi:hypothetical protein
MLTTVGLLSLLAVSGGTSPPTPAVAGYRPRVELWTNRGDDPYSKGEGARVYFRTQQDAYVTVLRVDTDGRVRILYPRQPWEDNFARGGREYEVQPSSSADAFYVDDYPGVGYIFAVAAADPFVYGAIESEDHWDYRVIADGRVRGDPYVALTDLAKRIVPDGYADWDYDMAPYYVQQHYDYPRFLCYDCHTYVSYAYWRPYDYSCVRFRIVEYDDPYYYPYRYYGGTRVVFTRPLRPEPRFIFKDRQGSDLFITRVPQRPAGGDPQHEVGVRRRDLGGTGLIPPPRVDPRSRPITGQEPATGESPRQRPITGEPSQNADRGIGRRQPDRPTPQPDRPDPFGRPDRPIGNQPDAPRHQDRPGPSEQRPDAVRPNRVPVAPPTVVAPERPRVEPRREPDWRPPAAPIAPERARVEPRQQPEWRPPAAPPAPPRAQPPAAPPPPPRSEPRVAPQQDAPRGRAPSQPELRRRKP